MKLSSQFTGANRHYGHNKASVEKEADSDEGNAEPAWKVLTNDVPADVHGGRHLVRAVVVLRLLESCGRDVCGYLCRADFLLRLQESQLTFYIYDSVTYGHITGAMCLYSRNIVYKTLL